jgi:hypothetical protein
VPDVDDPHPRFLADGGVVDGEHVGAGQRPDRVDAVVGKDRPSVIATMPGEVTGADPIRRLVGSRLHHLTEPIGVGVLALRAAVDLRGAGPQ